MHLLQISYYLVATIDVVQELFLEALPMFSRQRHEFTTCNLDRKATSLKSLESALELIILKSSSCSSEECLAASKFVKLMFTANLFAVFFFLAFLVAEKREKIKPIS
jgi:hypothetical protein